MSNPPNPKLAKKLANILETSQRLEQKNKEAAKEQLLRIQLLLAKRPLAYKYD